MSLSFPSEKIWIIDDTPHQLAALRKLLEMHGYEVALISDGVRAIHEVLENPPDLILLDIRMPGLDGFEICKFIKNHEDTEDIPILFITGFDDPEFMLTAFALGGDDYLSKPFKIDEVVARINFHLGKRLRRHEMMVQIDDLKAYSSMVAHDIKNPLGLMSGFAEQLYDNWDDYSDEDKRLFVNAIHRNSKKVSNIVDELLAFSLIRQKEIVREPLEMDAIWANVEQRVEQWWPDYAGTIQLPSEWPTVIGYAPWVEEVWMNYLSNAIKYGGADGGIEIGCTDVGHNQIQFWVKDSGPGLSEEAQRIVFTKHTRLKGAAQEGHGLGLAIVKRIVDKLHGQVGVESELGVGSCFFFTLPIVEEETPVP